MSSIVPAATDREIRRADQTDKMPPHERRADVARRRALAALVAIGADFRQSRLRAALSLRELSAITGISPAELSRIERGLATHPAYEASSRSAWRSALTCRSGRTRTGALFATRRNWN
jgi:hypothetical protein